MSKFDVILLFCFTCTVLAGAGEFYLITHGFVGFSSSFWTFLMAAVTGEIVMFSLYEIATKARLKIPRNIKGKHAFVSDMAEEDEAKEEGLNNDEQAK